MAKRHLLPGWRINAAGDRPERLGAGRRQEPAVYDERAVHLVGPRSANGTSRRTPRRSAGPSSLRFAALVTWKRHNLLTPLEEEPFDCIFLKNVLIYFDAESKQTVVATCWPPGQGGYLVVGPTEGIYTMLDSLSEDQALALPEERLSQAELRGIGDVGFRPVRTVAVLS